MRPALLSFALIALGALAGGAGCGAEIGDSCIISTDCSIDGTRTCDLESDGGYCTIRGCDFGTCPSEAVCVSFFLGSFDNQPCNPATEDLPATGGTDDCNPDELCALDGHCVDRSSEVRYCMRKCSSGGDCRSGYECRDEKLMIMDGGEPVPAPGSRITDTTPQSFCAQAPVPPPST
jgi:hypothetical protein